MKTTPPASVAAVVVAVLAAVVAAAAVMMTTAMIKQGTRASQGALFLVLSVFLLTASAYGFDHEYTVWGSVLAKYTGNGRVDYEALVKDRSELDSFISSCGEVPYADYEKWSLDEQMAFMINLYNAAAIQLAINHWPLGASVKTPTATITEIGGWSNTPWNIEFIPIFGHVKGLGHLEHDVLRPAFKDPRIHFAIVPASIGAAWLRSEPYLPLKLNEQLWEQERLYMTTRPELNRLEGNTLYLSPIFEWYKEDFGKKPGVLIFARRYYPELKDDAKIIYAKYDWSLNSAQH